MTAYSRSTLKAFFETGDIPFGQQYSDLIDSCLNIVETASQTIAGPLNPTELVTARISAGNANLTGTLTAAGTVSAKGQIFSNNNINVSGSVVATGGGFFAGGTSIINNFISTNGFLTFGDELKGQIATVSAAGTTQGAATPCSAFQCRLQGVNDGTATGFSLMANKAGLIQFLYNDTAASANLWPPTGGTINGLSVNAAFGMAARTMYTVMHYAASAYGVK